MSCPGVDLNLNSPSVGAPLHVACKKSNLKVVQKLVLSGADIMLKEPVKNLLPKDITDNQRIIFLLEKYEKIQMVQK